MKIALDEKRNIDDLSYAVGDWFVTGAAEMSLLSDQSVVAPNMQWIATIDTVEWVLSYNGAFWRFGTRAAYADDESSGPDATKLTFNIDGNIYNLAKGARLALTTDIPHIDVTLLTQGAAADAKVVGDALRSGFTPWVFSGPAYDPMKEYEFVVVPDGDYYDYFIYADSEVVASYDTQTDPEPLHSVFDVSDRGELICDRCLITPTKTS